METRELIKWSPELSVSVSELDNHHKKLISILNKFFDSMKVGSASKILDNILNELIDYTKYHFETEEKYFEKFNYEGKEEHIKEHRTFVNHIKELLEKNRKKDLIISSELLNFLTKWVIKHILEKDKKYTNCFNKNGLI